MNIEDFVEIGDFERASEVAMTTMARDYYAGGAAEEITLRGNVSAFQRLQLFPRMLVDVSHVHPETTVLGQSLSMPLLIAPTAFHRMAHPEGELATARAAKASGIGMVASSIATCSLEEIASCGPEPRWFQLYVYRDRALSAEMVARAEANGYSALVLTVDAPRFGRRYADTRNHFTLPEGMTLANFSREGLGSMRKAKGGSSLNAYVADQFDASLTWNDVEWLRGITKFPILVKGILRADDAKLALEHGLDGVVVSNHGGRQLDGVPPSIDALPAIADALQGKIEVLMDGGVRRGTDILKALSLVAKAVLMGRPILWGLASGGEKGVCKVLSLLREEYDLALMLAGCPSSTSVDSTIVRGPSDEDLHPTGW
jgi:4-hydroxymandelate oxidase